MGPYLRRMRVKRFVELRRKLEQSLEANRLLRSARYYVEQHLFDSDGGRAEAFSTLSRHMELLEQEGELHLKEYDALEAMLNEDRRMAQENHTESIARRPGHA